jgi:hypothetical protein
LAEYGMIVRRQNANRLWAGTHDFFTVPFTRKIPPSAEPAIP